MFVITNLSIKKNRNCKNFCLYLVYQPEPYDTVFQRISDEELNPLPKSYLLRDLDNGCNLECLDFLESYNPNKKFIKKLKVVLLRNKR